MINYCWYCELAFDSEIAPQCSICNTRICPDNHCFCSLTVEAQRAVDMAMKTYGLWTGNPRKKPSGLAEELYYAFKEKGIVKDEGEFLAKHEELYKKYPEIVEGVRKRREK